MRKRLSLLFAGVLALAGCGGEGGATSDPGTAFAERAAKVASEWQTTIAQTHQKAWQSDLIALQSLTVPPTAGLSSQARQAFDFGWYRSRIALPTQQPAEAKIALPGGGEITAQLVSADTAFGEIDRGDAPCEKGKDDTTTSSGTDASAPAGGPAKQSCVNLIVTSATLGTVRLRTNRGLLTVPAWLFQLDGLPAPVARVAVTRTTFAPIPRSGVTPWENPPVAAATKLGPTGDRSIELTLALEGCAGEPSGLVHETTDAVVVGGWAKAKGDGPCAGGAALVPVTVTLTQPLAAKVILDSVSGQPLT